MVIKCGVQCHRKEEQCPSDNGSIRDDKEVYTRKYEFKLKKLVPKHHAIIRAILGSQ